MKKLLFITAVIFASLIIIGSTGCNKTEKYPEKIVGNWKLEKIIIEDKEQNIEECQKNIFIEFAEGSLMVYKNPCENTVKADIQYKFTGESIQFTTPEGDIQTYLVTKLTSKKMTMQIYQMGIRHQYQFNKQ